MPRAKAPPLITEHNPSRDDEYATVLGTVVEAYKFMIDSDHPMASQLVDEFTDLFKKVRGQKSLIAALADKRQGGK